MNASSVPEAVLQAEVTHNEVTFNFPETATFQLSVDHPVDITSIALEYGNKQETCGEVVAKAFPQFTPGRQVDAEWTWEMLQSGSLPPGAQIWWRWRIRLSGPGRRDGHLVTGSWWHWRLLYH